MGCRLPRRYRKQARKDCVCEAQEAHGQKGAGSDSQAVVLCPLGHLHIEQYMAQGYQTAADHLQLYEQQDAFGSAPDRKHQPAMLASDRERQG